TLAPDLAAAVAEISRVEPVEVLLPPSSEPALEAVVQRVGGCRTVLEVDRFDARQPEAKAAKNADEEVRRAIGGLSAYVQKTRPSGNVTLGHLQLHTLTDHLAIDDTSFRNLEIVKTLVGQRRKGSLLGLMDRTVTAMGARQLRRWLQLPLIERMQIEGRLDAVAELKADALVRDDLRTLLGDVYDIERLGGRLVAGVASAKDMANLRRSLGGLERLRETMTALTSDRLVQLADALDPLADIHAKLIEQIAEDPAQSPVEGRVIRDGFDNELDELVALSRTGKDWIVNYEADQRKQTNIPSLKVRYNRVFGYFIEVTRTNLKNVPDSYIRKQTISTGERYFTMELKEYETRVLTAEEGRVARETMLFETLRTQLKSQAARVLRTASRVADLDVLSALAEVAHELGYVRPQLFDDGRLTLRDARHPVVERTLGPGEYVANDIDLHTEGARLLLITGPNMAGKSTVMRQVALTVLMAQIGSFVPAAEAEIGLCDRIFTRVGATDDLSRGQSTFMVEMTETAAILKGATSRSLIILDEIGRGTSTFDGLSIAWSVAEYLHDMIGARTMFATHYHELTELARTREHVKNVHVAVREWNEEIVFLRKLKEGATGRSYGIAVGRLAGLPDSVIARAREVLARLESTDADTDTSDGPRALRPAAAQLGLFGGPAPTAAAPSTTGLLDLAVAKIDVSRTTPLDALRLIDKWQRQLRKQRQIQEQAGKQGTV
ncbi:MAG: DNA mismatch repair protein MutS, partial [Myxococcota bacterium]